MTDPGVPPETADHVPTRLLRRRALAPGDPAPWFTARASNNPRFVFSATGGRYVLMAFVGTLNDPRMAAVWQGLIAAPAWFDDRRLSGFGITIDPADEASGRTQAQVPALRWFYDLDGAISRAYGAVPVDAAIGGPSQTYLPQFVLIDPGLRVLWTHDIRDVEHALAVLRAQIAALPPVALHAGTAQTAPVLLLPRVFEPEFCRRLITYYEANGGTDSGFMTEVDGITVGRVDHSHKRRSDCLVEDKDLRRACLARIERRLVPEIRKVFQFAATRLERYLVACYDGATGGYFRPHRDNTTKGTAHRRFAVTLNLDAEAYDGGDLRFPEFGPQTFRAPTGGCVVFSCSLLHEATPVTAGRRYAFLPFLYDEAGAELREHNMRFLDAASGGTFAASRQEHDDHASLRDGIADPADGAGPRGVSSPERAGSW